MTKLNNILLMLGLCLTSSAFSQELVTRNDTDGDGVVDTADIDDDNDGVPDVWEIAADGADIDTDKDGMPDRLDLDSDNDSLLDWQESGASSVADFSGLTIEGGRLLGIVGLNGMLNVFETTTDGRQLVYQLLDTDQPIDGIPDLRDLDSDNDGLPDMREAGVIPTMDADGDARIDAPPGSVGRDGIPDQIQRINDQTCCDLNADGADEITPRNTDGVDFPDFQDIDSDGDGIADIIEAGGTDADANGLVDGFADANGDGLDDGHLAFPLGVVDADGNGVGAEVDGTEQVANGETDNGTPDDQPQDDDISADREPVSRPDFAGSPLNDDTGAIQTGLSASGCSIGGSSYDVLLSLLAILSMAILGWRFTVRRLR